MDDLVNRAIEKLKGHPAFNQVLKEILSGMFNEFTAQRVSVEIQREGIMPKKVADRASIERIIDRINSDPSRAQQWLDSKMSYVKNSSRFYPDKDDGFMPFARILPLRVGDCREYFSCAAALLNRKFEPIGLSISPCDRRDGYGHIRFVYSQNGRIGYLGTSDEEFFPEGIDDIEQAAARYAALAGWNRAVYKKIRLKGDFVYGSEPVGYDVLNTGEVDCYKRFGLRFHKKGGLHVELFRNRFIINYCGICISTGEEPFIEGKIRRISANYSKKERSLSLDVTSSQSDNAEKDLIFVTEGGLREIQRIHFLIWDFTKDDCISERHYQRGDKEFNQVIEKIEPIFKKYFDFLKVEDTHTLWCGFG